MINTQNLWGNICFIIVLFTLGCKENKTKQVQIKNNLQLHVAAHSEKAKIDDEVPDVFQVSVREAELNFKIPAFQSAAVAKYDGKWLLIGGRTVGLHSLDNDPPAFRKDKANDSIWVIDLESQQSIGVPVPKEYGRNLSATSQQYYQVNEKLYLAGGFTVKDTSAVNNWTSDLFFEIDLPSLIDYVTNNATIPLEQVFTKVIQNPYVQVTGGEMMVVNNNFYIIGGQNYQQAYVPGYTGVYTNAIRKFSLLNNNGIWQLSDTLTLEDSENLHRRDFNMTETVMYGNDSIGAVIYGGVFTNNEMAYRHPVYINGLVSGIPTIEIDTSFHQKTNLYTGAKIQAALFYNDKGWFYNHTTFLGGISYMTLKPGADSLSVPEMGNELPFSNVISSFLTDGEFYSIEKVQLPPNEILPTYLGTNATFFAKPGFALKGHPEILDLNKIFNNIDFNQPVSIGYMYGGILSPVPNTFTSNGHMSTSTNKKLYEVFMTMKIPGS
ncbi:hypothetical protein [Maribacter sp. MAR_2009_72]|uniref:hypothetical protein n=1 Tax=Maribacter sp. MAR_2009_72 TaxID=1250050 RepID=UPI00119AF49E|nr:hypothetical protein [Maribacter sp. MAR_2009_72]TVZ14655.1 hypothetical protein JM81_0860 [Maribacter sp. MAR_2009_72]